MLSFLLLCYRYSTGGVVTAVAIANVIAVAVPIAIATTAVGVTITATYSNHYRDM